MPKMGKRNNDDAVNTVSYSNEIDDASLERLGADAHTQSGQKTEGQSDNGSEADSMPPDVTPAEMHKSLNLLIVAASFGMIFYTVYAGAPYNAYVRALGTGDLVYSIILALSIFGSLVQIISSYVLENSGKRKKMLIISGIIQRLPLIPVALIGLLVPASMTPVRIWLIIALVSVMSVSSSFVNISFASWIGSLIPQARRGRFFSKRTMTNTISAALASLASGLVLDLIPGFKGYAILFCVITVLGIMDILCYIWIKEPFYQKPAVRIPFLQLLKEPFKNRNYLKFIIFNTAWTFSVFICAPFFIVFMIEDLKMSFFIIMLSTQFITNIATVIFVQIWGRIIDKYGNKPIFKICGILMCFPPLIWLGVTQDTIFMIFIASFLGGAIWPSLDLATLNLSIWLAPEKNRSVYYAFFSIIVSVIGFGAAFIVGGTVMEYTGPILERLAIPFILGQNFTSFHLLMLLTFVLRLVTILFLHKIFHEENSTSARVLLRDLLKRFRSKVSDRTKTGVSG